MISKENLTDVIIQPMDNFGRWLVDILSERGMSQSDLARMAGISRGTVSNIISGKRGRGTDSLTAIARALKLPPETLYRAAELLPGVEAKDEKYQEFEHLLTRVPESVLEDVLEYLRFRAKNSGGRNDNKKKGPRA